MVGFMGDHNLLMEVQEELIEHQAPQRVEGAKVETGAVERLRESRVN